jgi:hypothetical protein
LNKAQCTECAIEVAQSKSEGNSKIVPIAQAYNHAKNKA